jgi:transposase
VPTGHPLRAIRAVVNEALGDVSPTFAGLYAPLGRPSIPPEQLLRALLLQAFYSLRAERQLMERLDFDLLFRWCVGLGIDDPVWDHATFSKNRDRLLAGDVAAEFLATLLDRPQVRRLLSSEHFSVDGSLIQAWASVTSFRPKDSDGGPSGGGAQPEPRLPRRAPEQPDARLHHRARCPTLPQGAGHGGAALLRRPRADGEP